MTVFNFPKWDKYDDNKNDVKRIDYIRGYFKDGLINGMLES